MDVNGVYKPTYNWGGPQCINAWNLTYLCFTCDNLEQALVFLIHAFHRFHQMTAFNTNGRWVCLKTGYLQFSNDLSSFSLLKLLFMGIPSPICGDKNRTCPAASWKNSQRRPQSRLMESCMFDG